jgi:hypothetical protein
MTKVIISTILAAILIAVIGIQHNAMRLTQALELG